MEILPTKLQDAVVIKPRLFADDRGYFFESYHHQRMQAQIENLPDWVQDNESRSSYGVLRGLHFQVDPHAQAKLVRVVQGKVQDVAVDLRKGSPTYGQWHSEILSAENKHQFYIPTGFAHGFLVLEEDSVFAYKCSNYYQAESERSIRWDDPNLQIDWVLKQPKLSDKDAIAPMLSSLKEEFFYQS